IALVVLEHERHLVDLDILDGEIFLKVFETLDVLFHLFPLGIGHEHDSIGAAQDELTRGVVNDLAGNRVELKLRHETFNDDSVKRQKIEEQRAIGGGGERDQFAAMVRANALMDVGEVGGFSTQGRPVINNLKLDLAAGVINDRHEKAPILSKRAKVPAPFR